MAVRRPVLLLLAALPVLAVAVLLLLGGSSGRPPVSETGVDFCTAGATGLAAEECAKEGEELLTPHDQLLSRVSVGSEGRTPASEAPRIRREVAATAARTERFAPRVAAPQWEFVGPKVLSGGGFGPGGRVLDLAVDVADSNTIYAATAGGGLFKSTDGGVTMVSTWPEDLPHSTSSVVQTKNGRLFVATGEAGPGGGSLTYGGDGVYRSDDRGKTWKRLPGLEKVSRISRIIADPTNDNRLFVAATGDLFKGSEDRGVYRTTDGGDSWTKVLSGDNPTTGASDIAIDPKDPKRLVAGMWDHIRRRDEKAYAGVGSGVFTSTDGGDTWQRVGTGVIGPNPALGRIGVAIDPQSPDTIYVIASGHVGGHAGFYKSTNFGTVFVPLVVPDQAGLSGAFVYGWWFGRVWVDPRKSNEVWTAGLDLLRSTNGGQTFATSSAGMHVDQHAMAWDPRIENRVWAGNDGGVYRSDDGGRTWVPAKVQPYLQPNALDVSEQDPSRVVIGMQDNGEARNYATAKREWTAFGPGGDGQRVLINPKNKNIVYACGQNGACQVSTDGGTSGTSFENQVISARKVFFMPIEFDLKTPSTIYTGGEIMNRSDDDGGSFTPISPDLSDGGVTERETNPLYRGYGGLSAIGTAPKEAGRLYAGTDDGNLWYANSGGGNVGPGDWTRATDSDLPDAYVSRIEVDQGDPKTAYVTYSGFRGGDNAAYVLKTKDGGENWDNITGNLPKAPVNDINIVGDKLVVAADFGVFASRDQGKDWFRVGSGLPQVPIYELRTHMPSRTVFIATFGRGVYKLGVDALDFVPGAEPAAKKGKLRLPATRSCRGGARFRFRVAVSGASPKVTLRRATITVSGVKKKITLRTARQFRQRVVIKLPRRKTTVSVTAVSRTGTKYSVRRSYKACA